jgi:hypothetical protein
MPAVVERPFAGSPSASSGATSVASAAMALAPASRAEPQCAVTPLAER